MAKNQNITVAEVDEVDDKLSLWLQNIYTALPHISQFILHGSIRDVIPQYGENGKYAGFVDVKTAIAELLKANGFDAVLEYCVPDMLVIRSLSDERYSLEEIDDYLCKACSLPKSDKVGVITTEWFESLDKVAAEIGNMMRERDAPRLSLVVDYASQAHEVSEMHPAIDRLMIACLKHVHESGELLHDGYRKVSLRHPVFWLVDKPNDLPGWMLTGDGIRQVPILYPDLDERMRIARAALQTSMDDKAVDKETVRRFAGVSEGLSIRSILGINKLVIAGDVSPERVVESAQQFRLGITENPWQKPELRERIQNGRKVLANRVYGQEKAIEKSLDILILSALNMTHAHAKDGGTGPRGVLFFAGATGVGKTELAKQLAKLIFGTTERIIRFDMSEFAQEHTEARLLGAPPSYIGHGAGGELTNAIRRQPHSVVLFDEIEKAHPAILDKFLQVLSDGRLTDGSGDTVFFTESIIIFTSNKGAESAQYIIEDISTQKPDGEALSQKLNEYEKVIRESVVDYFTGTGENQLGRPELLGRIGENNIIVFNPITKEIAETIASKGIDNIAANILKQLKCQITFSDEALKQSIDFATFDLSKGGRGIQNALKDVLVRPLAHILFVNKGIEELHIRSVTRIDADTFELEV
jgi:ATP-dependent Clp protease ATP-binding subunit ClpA